METCKEARAQQHREDRRKTLGAIAAKKLLAAREVLDRYTNACIDCGHNVGQDDDRKITSDRMGNLGGYLDSIHNRES